MKLLKLENSIIISPLLVNIGLSYAMMWLDIYLESYTLYMLLALLAMTIYPVFVAFFIKGKNRYGTLSPSTCSDVPLSYLHGLQ